MTECSVWARVQNPVGQGGEPWGQTGAGTFSGRLSRVVGAGDQTHRGSPGCSQHLCPSILCGAATSPSISCLTSVGVDRKGPS